MVSGTNPQSKTKTRRSAAKIRLPAVAGSFYPDDGSQLITLLDDFCSKTEELPDGKNLKALIVPHAGLIYSGQTAAWGYRQIPATVLDRPAVIIAPSHHYPFSGMAASPDNQWQTPLGIIRQIPPRHFADDVFPDDLVHLSEHSVEVQLPFLQYLYPGLSVTCFVTGQSVDTASLSGFLDQEFSGSLYIFSSDLSHYLPESEARQTDTATINAILKLDSEYLKSTDNCACGSVGISVLLQMAKQKSWHGKLIKYDTSASASGDKSAVVGYGAVGFYG